MDWFQQGILAPSAIVLGLTSCFYGAKTYRLILATTGFLAGASAGWTASAFIGDAGPTAVYIFCLVSGAIGAAVAIAACKAGVFLAGALVGAVTVATISAALSLEPPAWTPALGGLIGGVLALARMRAAVILTSAILGSLLAVTGFLHLTPGTSFHTLLTDPGSIGQRNLIIALIAASAMAIAGAKQQAE